MLSQEQIETFFDKGYIILENLFPEEEVKKLASAADEVYETSKKFSKTCMHENSRFVYTEGFLHRVVWAGAQNETILGVGNDERITIPVSQLLESKEIVQLINQLHFKVPGDGVHFPFHQDSENRGYGTEFWKDVNGKGSYVQTTLAIDPMTKENGPLLFLPYSGKKGHLSLDKKADQKLDLSNPDILELSPGSLALFGPYTVHGSYPNKSKEARKILINGYASPGANFKKYPGCGLGRPLTVQY